MLFVNNLYILPGGIIMTKSFGIISGTVSRIRKSSPCEIVRQYEEWIYLDPSDIREFRERLFTPVRTFWLFLSQVMWGNISCRETVLKALAWLSLEGENGASSNTGGYCIARKRLPENWIKKINLQVVEAIEAQTDHADLWLGRKVKIVDGSGISMPDTESNQKHYPQPKGQKPGCGFPVMRIVVMFSLATGAILRVVYNSLKEAERTMFQSLWKWLERGDIVLADRGFCSYAEIWVLGQMGVDSVMRNHQRRKKGVEKKKRLGPRDYLVIWQKTENCPEWLQRDIWLSMPDQLTLRQIDINVSIKGFRTDRILLVTTLLDPKTFPRKRFEELYLKRWMAELFLRDIKITMGMDVLKCKSPQMIHKELWMYILAYNLIRCIMFKAAKIHGTMPLRISFKGTVDALKQWTPLLAVCYNDTAVYNSMLSRLLMYIAKDIVPHRPFRTEPRARKRRPKNYQLLTKPRKLFKEIPHRCRYKKEA
jgi:hypothetical protein